jgi:hypothetical protein
MKQLLLLFASLFFTGALVAQSNILVTHASADNILKSNYNPADFLPSEVIDHPDDIVDALIANVSPDSLRSYLEVMRSFENRNTGADTSSATFGMGAARRWAFAKFQAFSAQAENRLQTAYLQFDQDICGMGQHRNIITVLPGVGPQFDDVVIIEGHLDSRCEDNCDVDCTAEGMEDNGSGSALVMELARVMSQFTFNRTIVFMLTTGEEQGLLGANAFAEYCEQQDINVVAVLNNDIIGGIICGETASPPGCPGLNDIDSTNVRIYSSGTNQSPHKGLARFVKLEYQENVFPIIPIPSVINIMTPEDRGGRGGDHIPFRQRGYPAIRFTSANEHGNGNPATPDYHDRQHTMEDVLGLDTDNDGELDSFFVDFNYLARNAIINGNAAAMAALGPITPVDATYEDIDTGIRVEIDDPNNYGTYRIGWHSFNTNDWDTVYTVTNAIDTLEGLPSGAYFISVAAVDSNGIESIFTTEKLLLFTLTGTEEINVEDRPLELMQNTPNPFDEATVIGVRVYRPIDYQKAEIVVRTMAGQELVRQPIELTPGISEFVYDYQYHKYQVGTYVYSLYIDGKLIESKQMIYAY